MNLDLLKPQSSRKANKYNKIIFQRTNMQLKNKSNFYLKQARVRRDAEEKELNLAIDKVHSIINSLNSCIREKESKNSNVCIK
jgi:hypothetical protein